MPTLTETELKIAICLTDSELKRNDIAKLQKCSINTLNYHIKNIFSKLQTDNRYGMVCALVRVYPQYADTVQKNIFALPAHQSAQSAA